jgi:hypothetical protein
MKNTDWLNGRVQRQAEDFEKCNEPIFAEDNSANINSINPEVNTDEQKSVSSMQFVLKAVFF